MKILVVTDTHGVVEPFIRELKKHDDADMIIHLGDMVIDAYAIQQETNIPVEIVRGNNDWMDEDTPWSKVIEADEVKIFATHGHREHVGFGTQNLVQRALYNDADVSLILYGHTHIYKYEQYGNVKVLNPGSAGYDRGGSFESYCILNIDGKDIEIERVEI